MLQLSFENIFDHYNNNPLKQTLASVISNAIARCYYKNYNQSLIFATPMHLQQIMQFCNEWGINIKCMKADRIHVEKIRPVGPKKQKEVIETLFDFPGCSTIKYSLVRSFMANIDHQLVSLHNKYGDEKHIVFKTFEEALQKDKIYIERLSVKEYAWFNKKSNDDSPDSATKQRFVLQDNDHETDFGQIGLYEKTALNNTEQLFETSIENNAVFEAIATPNLKPDDFLDFILEYTPKTYFKLLGHDALDLKLPTVFHATNCDDFSSEHIDQEIYSGGVCSVCNSSYTPILGLDDPWHDVCCINGPATITSGQSELNEEELEMISDLVFQIHENIKKGKYY